METGSGWGWKEKRKRTLLCRKVLPRSGLEPKGKLTGIKAENQRPWQCPSVIPFWASKNKTATANNGSRPRSIVTYFTFLCNLPLFSPSGPSPNLHFTLMSPTPSQNRRTWNKDQVNIWVKQPRAHWNSRKTKAGRLQKMTRKREAAVRKSRKQATCELLPSAVSLETWWRMLNDWHQKQRSKGL